MHVLINIEQMKTLAKLIVAEDINVSFAGNTVLAQEGEDLTLTVAQDGELKQWRINAEGEITESPAE